MGRTGKPRRLGHLCHLQGPGQSSQIADVRLNHVDRPHVDHPPPLRE